jgi:protease YdgD
VRDLFATGISGINRYFLHIFSALVCSISIFHAGSAFSQDLRPGIIGEDNRVIVVDEGQPWDAIGQVNISGYRRTGMCTGTLIAPNLVLTAAHCVMNPWEKRPYPARNIHFLAAVRGSQDKGHSVAKCLRFLDGYSYVAPSNMQPTQHGKSVPLDSVAKDAVAIVLDERIAVDPAPLAEGVVPQAGLRLVHAAYPADHRFTLSAHFGCQLLRSDVKSPFWINDCDTHPGSSGGPVLARIDGKLRLAAIMIASNSNRYNVALPISEWVTLTRSAECP